MGQAFGQPRTLVWGFDRSTVRSSSSFRLGAGNSFGTQGVQWPQRTQTRIFTMTIDEAQTNLDTVIGTMFVFGTPT